MKSERTNPNQRRLAGREPIAPRRLPSLSRHEHWVWRRDGRERARIADREKEQYFVLDHKVHQYGGDWETITQSNSLAHAECHYGGTLPYFRCNGIMNGRHRLRRVAKVFAGGRCFIFRHCYSIAYTSQSEPYYDRMLRRANKLRMALRGEAEAKFFTDCNSAISDTITSITAHITQVFSTNEKLLPGPQVSKDIPHTDKIKEVLSSTVSIDQLKTQAVFPLLIAANSAVTPDHTDVPAKYAEARLRRNAYAAS